MSEKELIKYIYNQNIFQKFDEEIKINYKDYNQIEKKVELLYKYFTSDNITNERPLNNLRNIINSDLEMSLKELEVKGLKFDNSFNDFKSLSKFRITFEDCIFTNIILKNNCTFKNCQIVNIEPSENISSISVEFEVCQIEKFIFIHKSENKFDKKNMNRIFFKNSKIDYIELEGLRIYHQFLEFNSSINIEFKEIKTLIIRDCIFHGSFKINLINNEKKKFKILKLDFTNSIFINNEKEESKVKIQFCDIEDAIFHNTKFQDLADFYQTEFKKVNFERTDFEKISVFSECEFDCDVDFKYTKFLGKAIFRDTVIKGKLDLRDTIFDDEANFLDITSKSRKIFNEKDNKEEFKGEATDIKVANRETARVIKNFFDSSNNTIEANRFYKLEMEERRKEFRNIPFFEKNDNHIFEMLIFFFHKISSNHSQSWALALFWIIFISFISSYLFIDNYCIVEMSVIYEKYDLIYTNLLTKYKGWLVLCLLFFTTIVMFGLIDKKWHISALFIFVIIISLLFYINLSKDYSLHYFSNLINPFSIMVGKEKLTIGLLVYKITIAYLIYQLIISIRQNTRRK